MNVLPPDCSDLYSVSIFCDVFDNDWNGIDTFINFLEKHKDR